ncbi:hypothetical protein BXY80_2252 [Ichthyenterobacterium magnum]|uniref:Uncharacterized protein n=1 Tax=Ichthyenterobacterium magnum TaxID=1230530 RepID=A0A420DGW7_9FLAO|nr:hypothetical protein BXY80_2252 [Ichthyenterobacterium magnum]
MESSYSTQKILLYLSLFSLVYFILIVYWSYSPPNSTNTIRFIGELLTIPMLMLIIFNFIYALFQILKKRKTKIFITILALNLVSIVFLIIVTINQLNS